MDRLHSFETLTVTASSEGRPTAKHDPHCVPQPTPRLAVVEDDRVLRSLLCDWISACGWACDAFSRGQDLLLALSRRAYDLVLLDLRLPDRHGLDLLSPLLGEDRVQDGGFGGSRSDRIKPDVLILTGNTDEQMVVKAFAMGARDYVMKPIRGRELMARIQSILRTRPSHAPKVSRQATDQGLMTVGPLTLHAEDPLGPSAYRSGQRIGLTPKEFQCAWLMLSQLGQLVSRDQFRTRVWHHNEAVQTRTIDTHVSRVRQKLCLLPDHGFRLTPIYGIGYRLDRIS